MYLQNSNCFYCYIPITTDPKNYQIDHKEPIFKGGTNELENLCIACKECNQFKSYHKMPQKGKARSRTRKIRLREESRARDTLKAEQMHAYMDGLMFAHLDREL